MSFKPSYTNAVEEVLPVIKNIFKSYLDINTSDEIVHHLVMKSMTGFKTNLTTYIDVERKVKLGVQGTPMTDGDKIIFPLQFASKTYCMEYFNLTQEDADTMKWLISFYGMLHEGLHNYLTDYVNLNHDNKYKDIRFLDDSKMIGKSLGIYSVVENVVLDLYIENRLAQNFEFVNNVINFGKDIFFHPYKLRADHHEKCNVNLLHTLRSHSHCEALIAEFEELELAEQITTDFYENVELKDWHLHYRRVVDEVYAIFHEKVMESPEAKQNKKATEDGGVTGDGVPSYVEGISPDFNVKISLFQEYIEYDVKMGIEKEVLQMKDAISNKMNVLTRDGRNDIGDGTLDDFEWVSDIVHSFFVKKKVKSWTNYNQVSGIMDLTQPATIFTGTSFARYKRKKLTQDRPDIVIGLDASMSMQLNKLWIPCLSLSYYLHKGFVDKRFSSTIFTYGESGGNANINLVASNLAKDFNGKPTGHSIPDEKVFLSQQVLNRTPEYDALKESHSFFNFDSNKEKVLLMICDGGGNIYPHHFSSSNDACSKEIEGLEKLGVKVFYCGLLDEVCAMLKRAYGEDRVLDFTSEDKMKETLPVLLSTMVTTFS